LIAYAFPDDYIFLNKRHWYALRFFGIDLGDFEGQRRINLENISKGIYIIRIVGNITTSTRKLIVR